MIFILQDRQEIVRLSAIITGGFFAPDDVNPWTQFLVRGLYDPRILLVVADFAQSKYVTNWTGEYQ